MSGQVRRLASGGRIDRDRGLRFTFDGRVLEGYAGDTLASALLANGVDVVGRSFKYARPRGIVGHGAEEPNAIVQLGSAAASVPNLRATQVGLYNGLEARSTGAPVFQRAVGTLGRFLPAGFYYKTFMGSARLWMASERLLRHAAGFGRAPVGADPDTYDRMNRHCDVLVVGAGPAGLSAALEAARSGARVLIADEQAEFGGSLLAEMRPLGVDSATAWVDKTIGELASRANVEMLPRSTVSGFYDHNFLTIVERRTDHLGLVSPNVTRERLHRVRAEQVVLATGAIERPLVFANNDLPGVMLASAVGTYVNRYAVAPGDTLLLFTTNNQAYRTALDWRRVGRDVCAIVDVREAPGGELVAAAREAGIEVIAGHVVIEAIGRSRVAGAVIAPLNASGDALDGPTRRLRCDLVAFSGGWNPTLHLGSQTGVRPRWSEDAAAFLPGDLGECAICTGAVTGTGSLRACLEEGALAGATAASRTGFGSGRTTFAAPVLDEPPGTPARPLYLVPHTRPVSRAPKQFVDYQLDVTAADIELAAREGYQSVEHVKRYTALGFGTDQGKLGNVNGVAILARALGKTIAETGTTMFRPSYTPATFGTIAGRDVGGFFDPERHTPMHTWHEAQGAAWENVGRWKRPWYYPRAGETMQQAVNRECLAARDGVAILDASTLGKIDIQGTDAAEFLDRVYTIGFRRLGVGRCRYGLMLREDGTIFDDGVTARLAENRYLMHTTTGNAEAVFAWLELWHQTEWPDLDVYFTSVTDHWATAALVGPRSREVLANVGADIDLSRDAFRFMDVREGEVAGFPARVFRISFSGELSFEVNVPAQHGRGLWDVLIDAGSEFGITPYGTETMHVLRAEKGFIIVGQDTDGSMTPADMGMDWAVRRNKPFGFLGDRSLALADHRRPDRPQLVGLASADGDTVLPEGGQLVDDPKHPPPVPMAGHVTSSYYSARLSRPIALGVVKGGSKRIGETVYCPLADGRVLAGMIVDPVFYDPEGERQNV
ncbi:MAG: sarcosine oxidase subunit alpha family protein [Gammaproteobacteria bacterium]|nr:sarcosine oxidase subunit alpha family protein [Gammaproteobacteria bacterium]MYJ75999.1 sarcosine oxidase subunit alpha family protein [Gammaproteobacteria bacterium]